MAGEKKKPGLPERLRQFFWDYDFASLSWEEDHHLITARILASGDWESVKWLRATMGDATLRQWILDRRGRGLSPRQLRFWQLILDLPSRAVDTWLAAPERQIWDRRARK
jgi:hypothetical protein